MKEFITVDDDGQFVMGKGVGGLGDFHCDLKSLFDTQNIMKASADFLHKRSCRKLRRRWDRLEVRTVKIKFSYLYYSYVPEVSIGYCRNSIFTLTSQKIRKMSVFSSFFTV